MSIHFILALNRQGKVRISKWFNLVNDKKKNKMSKMVHKLISTRDQSKQSNFVLFDNNTKKLIYRRYNGLFFIICIDLSDNELYYFELIQLFVEILDIYFNSVCELDLVFEFFKIYNIIDEMFASGELQETNKELIIKRLQEIDKVN
ncbi:hypothetical protein B5S31_g1870 [[Candida] boidinii]|nr:hypothetical protein B5S29_g4374 [[Candida] boidinii]OWB72164.1 hypothetical protein B5S31_g1870 [[Candida] boidinii]